MDDATLFTFLFTDIEGSTRLLQQLGSEGPSVMQRHHEILGSTITEHGGGTRRTEGDSFFATFESPVAAVRAAVEIQRRLAAEDWPAADGLHVRIGLHTGEAVEVGIELVGVDVHRAARVMSIGWGDQVLLSDATAALVKEGFDEVTLRDLGQHRLKDLTEPERIHQVVADGLRDTFPQLRSLDAVPNNLPTQLTSFVGRDREIAEIVALLSEARAVTLTGPGGTGKTRLSLQSAAEDAGRHPDGVHFVPLAAVTDPALVMSAVATALGLSQTGNRTPLEQVIDHLKERSVLLVLDNFEQVLDAAPDVAKLLAEAPGITVLTSSRAPLHISGEHEYAVPPLTLPEPSIVTAADLETSEAATLFLARARAAKRDFALTEANAPSVAEILARLDGLPLAIELAATRVKVLSVEAIAKRLGETLGLLSSGARDLPDRQRTLRGAIAWGHDLLDWPAKVLFARFAVFRGGAMFDQIEAVCGPGLDGDLFDVLAQLIDHSLVRRLDAEADSRFLMLETIREYAVEQLDASDEREEIRRRHAASFLALAQEAEPHLLGVDRRRWLDRLEADHDNLRAAIRRSLEDEQAETALSLVAALWRLWQIRGHLQEAHRNALAALALPDVDEHPNALAAAEEAAGGILYWLGDLDAARDNYERALELNREHGSAEDVARSLYNIGFTFGLSAPERAIAVLDEAVAAFEAIGDETGVARAHWGLTVAHMWARNYDEVGRHADLCIPRFREEGATFDLAWALHMRGMSDFAQKHFEGAKVHYREALEMFIETNDTSGMLLLVGDYALLAEAVEDWERSLRLFGAVDRLADETGSDLLQTQLDILPRFALADDVVGAERAAELRAEGRAMSRDEAVAYALEG